MLTRLTNWWNKPADDVSAAMASAFKSGRLIEREANAQLCEARAKLCEQKAGTAKDRDDATQLRALAWQFRVLANDMRQRGSAEDDNVLGAKT